MSFPLRADVSEQVLSAFASIAVPHPDAPALPPAVDEDPFEEWFVEPPDVDMSDPWSHDWGDLLGASFTTSYIGSAQGASMVWRGSHWVVTSRATLKAEPAEYLGNLAILGSIIDATVSPQYPEHFPDGSGLRTGFLVGYARHEYEPRPWLLWADGQTLHGENLNPPGFF